MKARFSIRKRGENYFARFRDATGRRVEVVLDTTLKGEAQDRAYELAHEAWRKRRGLSSNASGFTLNHGWKLFSEAKMHQRSFKDRKQKYEDHIKNFVSAPGTLPLGEQAMEAIDAGLIELLMSRKVQDGYSLRQADHLRAVFSAVYNFCLKKKRMRLPANPAEVAERLRIPDPIPKVVAKSLIPRMLDAAPWWSKGSHWSNGGYPVRALIATYVYLGDRKGESLGLRPEDVDLENGVVFIRRSYDNDTTKDGNPAPVGIPAELVPYLEWALENCRGEWLFSRPDGSIMSKHTKIEKWIRKAFSDAGIVAGYWHRCVSRGQRKACVGAEGKPIKERRKSPERIPCPKCKRPMWVTPIPVSYSTKDLRSTLVTHLSEASKDIDLAARQARHADREVTAKFYRLANVKHLVDGVQVLRFRDGDSAHRLPHNSQENTQKEAKEHKPRMSGGKIT